MAFDSGLLTISGAAVEVFRRLDAIFRQWAQAVGAVEYQFPPVISAGALHRADYFSSFPHLTTVATCLRDDSVAGVKEEASRRTLTGIGKEHLADASYVLPSAACYSVYDCFRDRELPADLYVTVLSPCFRREEYYEPARRQWAFWMREIVCVGRLESVTSFLDGLKKRISDFLTEARFPFTIDEATDPFFDRRDSKLIMQRMNPLKHEFRYKSSLAIASVNFHRNFFGERFGIRDQAGHPAFSGCVAFGMERWLYSLFEEYGSNWESYPPAFHAASNPNLPPQDARAVRPS
jgi:seryl-tRNA synthetase